MVSISKFKRPIGNWGDEANHPTVWFFSIRLNLCRHRDTRDLILSPMNKGLVLALPSFSDVRCTHLNLWV